MQEKNWGCWHSPVGVFDQVADFSPRPHNKLIDPFFNHNDLLLFSIDAFD
jgi:hypothetical protein